MLSTKEKYEILKDARCPKRKAAFRKTAILDANPSIDAYLKFLTSVHMVFSQVQNPKPKSFGTNFKL